MSTFPPGGASERRGAPNSSRRKKDLRALPPERGGECVSPLRHRCLTFGRQAAVTLVGSCFVCANLKPRCQTRQAQRERSQARARSQSRRPAQAPSPDQNKETKKRKKQRKETKAPDSTNTPLKPELLANRRRHIRRDSTRRRRVCHQRRAHRAISSRSTHRICSRNYQRERQRKP